MQEESKKNNDRISVVEMASFGCGLDVKPAHAIEMLFQDKRAPDLRNPLKYP